MLVIRPSVLSDFYSPPRKQQRKKVGTVLILNRSEANPYGYKKRIFFFLRTLGRHDQRLFFSISFAPSERRGILVQFERASSQKRNHLSLVRQRKNWKNRVWKDNGLLDSFFTFVDHTFLHRKTEAGARADRLIPLWCSVWPVPTIVKKYTNTVTQQLPLQHSPSINKQIKKKGKLRT